MGVKKSTLRFIVFSLIFLLLSAALWSFTACKPKDVKDKDTFTPNGLKINAMADPLGVPVDDVRFSWQMNDPDDNEIQTAYRIVIAKTRYSFYKRDYIYNSGWVSSSENSSVKFENSEKYLKPNGLYFWAVATKDKDGNRSGFSDIQAFSTQIRDWESMKGIWADSSVGERDSFVFLRSRFNAKKFDNVEKVIVSVTATDTEPARQFVYNLYLNGQLIGLGPCREGADENGNSVLYYNTYDVTQYVLPKENVISAINYADDGKLFLCQITAFYTNGMSEVWVNSGRDYRSWKGLPADGIFGKDNSIGTGYYTAYANNINANIYPFGFATNNFDDSGWIECFCSEESINEDKLLKSGQYSPVKRFERAGASVERLSGGDWLIDLKQEIVGGIKLSFDGVADGKVDLYYGEQLNGDGTVKWHMNTDNKYRETFTLKAGRQTIETIDLLTYRYVQISGYDNLLTENDVRGLEVRAEFDDNDSYFDSSSQLLNEIFALTKNTIKYTTQDIMVDSQSRERRCYEGDLLINALASYAVSSDIGAVQLSLEYILTHKTDFLDYRLMPVMIAKQHYLYTGNDEIIRKYFDILKADCSVLPFDNNKNLVITENAQFVMDWPENDRDGYDMSVKYNTAYNCMQYKAYADLAYIADVLGDTSACNEARHYADLIKKSLTDKFYDKEKGAFCDGMNADGTLSAHYSQHATAYALWAGVYEQDMLQPMADFITGENKIKTSVFGVYFLLDGLYKSGYGDRANALLLDDDISEGAKTWAYMIKTLKATLTTEAWNESIKDNMTFSHPWSASPAYFVQSGICGINPTSPGFGKFTVKPSLTAADSFAYKMQTVKGKIGVDYCKNAYGYSVLKLEIPSNTTAQVYVECTENSKIYINGEKADAEYSGGYRRYEIGSGKASVEIRP